MEPIEKFMQKHYADGMFHTHVSLIHPMGKFQFNRKDIEDFWDIYCKSVYQNPDIVVGIAEKAQQYLPVLVDVDLKVKEEPGMEFGDHIYNEIHVSQLIEVYQSVLRSIVEDCRDEHLTCVLLEKPIYYISAKDTSYIKNGLHLAFCNIWLSKADQEVHLIPRVQQALRELETFADLGYEDSGNVIDKQCCKVPWLLYGSRKSPDMDPYLVTRVINAEGNEVDLETAFKHYRIYDMNERLINIKGRVEYYLPRILSIIPYGRQVNELKHGLVPPLKEKMQAERAASKVKNNTKVSVENALKQSAQLLPMLSDFRAEDRNEWMTIGWTLYSISEGSAEGLEQWMDFSKRCEEKFDEASCIYEWERMLKRDLSVGTLKYYASIDNPEKYMEFKKNLAAKYIEESVNGSHYDIAKVLHAEYGQEFVCASIASKSWYQFMGNRWEEIEEGVFLREKISSDVVTKYIDLLHTTFQEIAKTSDKVNENTGNEKVKLIRKIMGNLKSAPFKNNIMREALDIFYDKKFKNKLDQNPYLIGFKNGVYDLKLNIFRAGRPEDYISKCMPIDYKEFSYSDDEVKMVENFLEKVFPDTSVRQYFLDTSSDVFVGGNFQKIVLFWTGSGDNGKSVTQTLFEKMLGELAIKFDTTLLTGKKVGTGSAAPELARAGPPIRWATLEEPDNDEELNIGLLKKLSGNDSYWARDLFEKGKSVREVTPMFKLIFICLAGNTSISLSSGISVSIDKMTEMNRILSWDSKSDGLISTHQHAFIDKGEQECITLTLLDGREITCTPNHKFLTSNNQWIEAKNIVLNSTQLKMGIDNPKCDDIFDDYEYIFTVGNIKFNMKNYDERLKASALCRIIGYVITDGSQNKQLYMGHKIDANSIVDDIELLTSKRPKISNNRLVIKVNLPTELSNEISKIVPIQKGGKVNNEMFLPDFIFDKNCPTFLIREVIAGLFGGDGIIPSIIQNQCSMIQLVASKVEDHVQSLVNMFTKLSVVLLERFNIESIVSEPKYYKNYKTDLSGNNKYHVFLRICKNESILSYIEKVGVRHCCHKSYRLMAVASILRYKKSINKQNQMIIDRTRELLDKYKKQNPKNIIIQLSKDGEIINKFKSTHVAQHETGLHHSNILSAIKRDGTCGGFLWRFEKQECEILDEKGCEKIKDAYDIAVNEIRQKYGFSDEDSIVPFSVLRTYYLLYNHDYRMPAYKEEHISKYLINTGLNNFCNNHRKIHHYSVDADKHTLPCYQMSVINIKNVGVKHVYDINVEEPYSNFVAEGIVTHNCNKLPKLKYSDKATWNRIRVIPFESTFVRPGKPCPETYEEQLLQKCFPMDLSFSEKIPSLLEPFAWYLLQHRQKITIRIDPPKVREACELYRKQNDIYRQFMEESICDDSNSYLSLVELYSNFKEWFKSGFPSNTLPIKNEVKEYFEKLWGNCEVGSRWQGYRIRTLNDEIGSGDSILINTGAPPI
jgi:phage/plasmid-associated DNA primase